MVDLNKFQLVIPEQYRALIPFLLLKAPKTIDLGGRDLPVHDTLMKILSDGVIDQNDAFTILAAYLSALPHQAPAATPPAPAPVPFPFPPSTPPTAKPWTPPTGSGPVAVPPPASRAIDLVAGLGIEFRLEDTLENNRAPIGYTINETPEAYEIVLANHGTTNFPLHGGAYLSAVYLDANGIPINFEQRGLPELYNTAIWEAKTVDGLGNAINTVAFDPALGRYNQVDQGAHVANWNNEDEQPKEATRTGGMDVPVHFPDEANDRVIEITVKLATGVVAKPIRFPKVS